jgi:hypothetical protein
MGSWFSKLLEMHLGRVSGGISDVLVDVGILLVDE